MNLSEEIQNNWGLLPTHYAVRIRSIFDAGFEAWTVWLEDEYGAAIPYDGEDIILEKFSGAYLRTGEIFLGTNEAPENSRKVLMLTAFDRSIARPFSALCAEFVFPGENGKFRNEITENPALWWMSWKELLGNKNVDERVYDVLGELYVLCRLAEKGKLAQWEGPNGATYDIDCEKEFFEVKSTLSHSDKSITLNNQFQLDPPKDTMLYIVFCQFERAQEGLSINGMVEELKTYGYTTKVLNDKLKLLGLEVGRSARDRKYMLHAATVYEVSDDFPAIRPSSFIGGMIPKGVITITYSISLDGLDGTTLDDFR